MKDKKAKNSPRNSSQSPPTERPEKGSRGSEIPSGDWRHADPDYQAQATHYAEPIPSRQLIQDVLAAAGAPMTLDDLVGHFALGKLSEQEALAKRLGAMVRDGQLVQNRRGAYGQVDRMQLVAGTVQAHRDGFGFLIPDAGGTDLFLPPRQMRALMNGDRVLVRPARVDERGRQEASVVEVIERGHRSIVGRLHIDQDVSYVIPDNPRLQQDLLIPPQDRAGARHGQMVVAEIVVPPGTRTLPVGKVTEILGDHLAAGMEIEAAIRAHGLPHAFPDAVEAELASIPDEVRADDAEGRRDLRELPLVTIDGADARDFDDAVCARRNGDGWTLWVAIADVSAYVEPGTALDAEALQRGNSVYFPGRVIPMLPEKLSNGLCSLNPDVDRLCMVCEMRVDADGEVGKSKFYEAVMRSKARLIYEDVAELLESPAGEEGDNPWLSLAPQLRVLDEVFAALLAARGRRGAIDFESSETRIVFSSERKIDRIVPVKRNRAHRLIEECMIAANVEAARFIAAREVPVLYRIHEPPDGVKLNTLREFLALRALRLGGGVKPTAKDFATLTDAARERPDAHLLQGMLLRSMMQAKYNPDNVGHFGLALEHYAHFTSPIRRYPDLLLHRAIKHALARRKPASFAYDHDKMAALGTHCSMTERRADEATRDVVLWLKCEFMRHRIGDRFEGTISSVAPFGVFVELDELYIEGLVHVSSLRNDYYAFDPARQSLVGNRSGFTYTPGDRVRVRVVRVDLDERKIDLELDPANGAQPNPKGKGASPPAADRSDSIHRRRSDSSADSSQPSRRGKRTGSKRQRTRK